MSIELVVWDFDGVLNANMIGGRFVWADRMQDDLGIDPNAFSDFLFASGLIRAVVRGEHDLLEVCADWLAQNGHAVPARAFLSYWFEQDARPDPAVIAWMQAHPARQVIGTNNETHRSAFIETAMGFSRLVERVFSSGRLGVAKPEAGFFEAIEEWSGVAPGRILLVDDSAPNVAAVEARGWQGFHFTEATRAALPERLGLA